MSGDERKAWDLHGTRPEWWTFEGAKPAEKTEPVTPEPAAAAPATDDDSPAVDAKGEQIRDAAGKFVSKRQHAINERIRTAVESGTASEKQLREAAEQRARDLEARLAALERGEKPAAAEPAKSAHDGKPKWAEFEAKVGTEYQSWGEAQEAYQDARDAWKDAQASAASAKTEAERTVERTISDHLAREADLIKTVPEYHAKTLALREMLDKGLAAGAPLVLPLLESPLSAQLILHFAEHMDDLARIGRLGEQNLPAALRALGKLEATLEAAATRPAEPAAPVRKTISDAPAPPTVLGTRSAEPANAVHAAVASRNFRAYDDEMTKRDLARVRR